MMSADSSFDSWGGLPKVSQSVLSITNRHAQLPVFEGKGLPRGNGRSYGDSCLCPGGTLLDARGLSKFIDFDASSGMIECEGGVTLGEIIDLALPHGWFLPVTPGTQFATVAGAIANDVHGKNHHVAGSFGHHVQSLALQRSDGERIMCQPGDLTGYFEATVGGLGLTGLITEARLQLKRVPGPWLWVDSIKFGSLTEFFDLSRSSAARFEYSVAWVDCTAHGRNMGRGHFLRGDHAAGNSMLTAPKKRHLTFPVRPPFSLVNQLTLKPFNSAYYYRQRSKVKSGFSHFSPYFYPLDGINMWNRMYGRRGFFQYQSVLPPDSAEMGTREMLQSIANFGKGSFLAVLKEFGSMESLGLMSFPRPGTTLAIDFANDGADVLKLMKRLDEIVTHAGGALYPGKDARMSSSLFKAGFPNWEAMSRYLDPRFESGFWKRVME